LPFLAGSSQADYGKNFSSTSKLELARFIEELSIYFVSVTVVRVHS
jgi:hypothetical protein